MSGIEPIDLGDGLVWSPPDRETEDAQILARLEMAALTDRAVLTVRLYGLKGGHVDVRGKVEKTEEGYRITPV